MVIIEIALPALALVSAAFLVSEVRRFKTGRHLISARRLALRLIAGVILIGLIVAVYAGIFVFRLESGAGHPQLFLIYWSACLLGALALILVMLADLREVGERYTQRQHEIWRDFARSVAGTADKSATRPADKPATRPADKSATQPSGDPAEQAPKQNEGQQ